MAEDKWTSDELEARAMLGCFTVEKPMLVGPNFFAAMKKQKCLVDMMDRVRVYPEFEKEGVR